MSNLEISRHQTYIAKCLYFVHTYTFFELYKKIHEKALPL